MLNTVESQRKLSKGEMVFAVYPETTSFYLAIVVQVYIEAYKDVLRYAHV